MTLVGFDADGVLIDSRTAAWRAAERILAAFGESVSISSSQEMAQVFGHAAQNALVGPEHAASLRMMHRLVMRRFAGDLPLFEDVLATLADQVAPRVLVTAALADGIIACLGPYAQLFDEIVGFESGRKPELLARFVGRASVYVTDTVADIQICKSLGLPTIACSWGYDDREQLQAARPDAIAETASELAALLNTLTHNKEVRHVYS